MYMTKPCWTSKVYLNVTLVTVDVHIARSPTPSASVTTFCSTSPGICWIFASLILTIDCPSFSSHLSNVACGMRPCPCQKRKDCRWNVAFFKAKSESKQLFKTIPSTTAAFFVVTRHWRGGGKSSLDCKVPGDAFISSNSPSWRRISDLFLPATNESLNPVSCM